MLNAPFGTEGENILHLLGDVFAHVEEDNKTAFPPDYGHGVPSIMSMLGLAHHDPDNPHEHYEMFMKFTDRLYKVLSKVAVKNGRSPILSLDQVRSWMWRVSSKKTYAEQLEEIRNSPEAIKLGVNPDIYIRPDLHYGGFAPGANHE